jgi:hypothetical protein
MMVIEGVEGVEGITCGMGNQQDVVLGIFA